MHQDHTIRSEVIGIAITPTSLQENLPHSLDHKNGKFIPPQASSLVLVVPIKNGLKPLTYFQLSAQLKKWVKMINLDPKYYTFHCLRQGGVTWAFDADISNEAIRLMGDWASDAYKVTACYQKIQCRN